MSQDPYIIETTPDGLKSAILLLRDDFESHIHDGVSSRQLEDIVARSLQARAAITAQSILLATGGYLRSGQTAYDTGVGFWLGSVSGTVKVSFGNSAGNKFTFDGTNIAITGSITGSTITGGTIQTAASGQRITLLGSDNTMKFYNSGGNQRVGIGSDANYAIRVDDLSSGDGGIYVISAVDNTIGMLVQSTSNVTVNGIQISLSNAGSGNDGYGLYIAHAGTGRSIDLAPSGTAAGVYINSSGGIPLQIIHTNNSYSAIDVTYSGQQYGLRLEGDDSATTNPTLYVINNASDLDTPAAHFEKSVKSNVILRVKSSLNTTFNHSGLEIDMANSDTGLAHAISFKNAVVVGSAVSGTQNKKVRVLVGGGTYYIPCYDA